MYFGYEECKECLKKYSPSWNVGAHGDDMTYSVKTDGENSVREDDSRRKGMFISADGRKVKSVCECTQAKGK